MATFYSAAEYLTLQQARLAEGHALALIEIAKAEKVLGIGRRGPKPHGVFLICDNCEKVRWVRPSLVRPGTAYCSTKCWVAAGGAISAGSLGGMGGRQPQIIEHPDLSGTVITCIVCGTQKYLTPAKFKARASKFCSQKCNAAYKHAQFVEGPHPACRYCGKPLLRARNGGGKAYCNYACLKAQSALGRPVTSQNKRVAKKCQCGKDFWPTAAQVRDGYGKFCSRPCAAVYGHVTSRDEHERPRGITDVPFLPIATKIAKGDEDAMQEIMLAWLIHPPKTADDAEAVAREAVKKYHSDSGIFEFALSIDKHIGDDENAAAIEDMLPDRDASLGLCSECEEFSEELQGNLCPKCYDALENRMRQSVLRGLPGFFASSRRRSSRGYKPSPRDVEGEYEEWIERNPKRMVARR